MRVLKRKFSKVPIRGLLLLSTALVLSTMVMISDVSTSYCAAQTKRSDGIVVDRDETEAKAVAIAVLKLLHNNELSKLYRERISDLQKTTGLTSEAKAIAAYAPMAQITPGDPKERSLLNSRRTDLLPVFFRDHKADYYVLVFLSKYPDANWLEEVYLVKENGEWKLAGFLCKTEF